MRDFVFGGNCRQADGWGKTARTAERLFFVWTETGGNAGPGAGRLAGRSGNGYFFQWQYWRSEGCDVEPLQHRVEYRATRPDFRAQPARPAAWHSSVLPFLRIHGDTLASGDVGRRGDLPCQSARCEDDRHD